MQHLPTLLDIIEAGLSGDRERVRAYTQLLLERIQDDERMSEEERARSVGALQFVLARGGKQPACGISTLEANQREPE